MGPLRDHFIEINGESVTLRKITNAVYDAGYDELDMDSSTKSDSTIKVLLQPGTAQVYDRILEGENSTQEDMSITFKSDCVVAIGDFILINGAVWQVDDLNKRTYQGMSPFKGTITEPRVVE